MLPKKDHLQVIVTQLEKFEGDFDKSYNFQEFFDRCRAIFPVKLQEELDFRLSSFMDRFKIDTLRAQNILYDVRVRGQGGRFRLRVELPNGEFEKETLSISSLEYGLRGIMVWCRKQIIKMVKDEQVDFTAITDLDLRGLNA